MSHPLWALIPLTASAPPDGGGSALLYASKEACSSQARELSSPGNEFACVPAYMNPAEFEKAFGALTPKR